MEPTRISVADVRRKLNRGEVVTFLDVRSPQAWDSSDRKIAGALRARTGEELRAALRALPKARSLVTYCT